MADLCLKTTLFYVVQKHVWRRMSLRARLVFFKKTLEVLQSPEPLHDREDLAFYASLLFLASQDKDISATEKNILCFAYNCFHTNG